MLKQEMTSNGNIYLLAEAERAVCGKEVVWLK